MLRLLLFMLRAFGPRWDLSPVVADYIESAQRLGRDSHIPTQLVPLALRLWSRGWLNKRFLDSHRDWVLPYWAVHQLAPADAGFVAHGLQPVVLNSTHRDWTAIGNPDRAREAIVDPRGLVTPQYDGWSLDTWLGLGEQLYLPSRIDPPDLQQSLLENLPIVQTRYQAGGLRVLQDAFAAEAEDGSEWVVAGMTVENPRTEPARATAYLSVRPFNPEGVSLVRSVEFRAGDEGLHSLHVNRSLAAVIPACDSLTCSNEMAGDVVFQIPALDGSRETASAAGVATAAAAFQLQLPPHSRRVISCALAMGAGQQETAEIRGWTTAEGFQKVRQETSERWRALLDRGMQIRVPDDRLQDAFQANKSHLLVLHDRDSITPGPYTYHQFWFRDAAFMLNALDQLGYHSQVESVLDTYPGRLRKDGYYLAEDGEWDANGQALWSLAQHTRLSGDLEVIARQYWPLLNAAHWIDATRQGTRSPARPLEHGLLPSGLSAEHLGNNDFYYWDDFWGLAGLQSAEYAARAFDKKEDAEKLHAAFEAFRADVDSSLARAVERHGAAWMPASPYRRADSAMVANLIALYPLQLMRPGDPRISATLDKLREVAFEGDEFFHHIGHSGLGTYLSLHIAGSYLLRRDAAVWPIIRALLDRASPTFTWAEAIHPRSGHGGMGDGHHGWAAAEFISAIRNSLLFEEGEHLVLTPVLPVDWTFPTLSVRVDHAPTFFGVVGYTLAFGDRSATLALRAEWRQPPEYVEWNLPFPLKSAGGDKPGVELIENRIRMSSDVRKVVATW